jgi:hypothetical protein
MGDSLRDEILRFRLAQADMEQAAAAAAFLVGRRGGEARAGALDRAVETGLVVCYARPFGASNRVGGAGWALDSSKKEPGWVQDDARPLAVC